MKPAMLRCFAAAAARKRHVAFSCLCRFICSTIASFRDERAYARFQNMREMRRIEQADQYAAYTPLRFCEHQWPYTPRYFRPFCPFSQ